MNTACTTSSNGFASQVESVIFLSHAIAIRNRRSALVALSGGCYCAIILRIKRGDFS
ncbi:hypothetical protein FHT91_005254 [Rhizobium sp. BK347]|nr:hypothetical protein [Rhizobium sp. BK252]MBB3405028.1 hypothetical protein [Rhizobium sp. BK289]MBB3417574.1 hypothetical protein [Rhizobium sp. BK284]MBB3485453.1 hypothetical protein [Rhizobium sp. BK347]